MTHFGVLSRPDAGHLNPLVALGRELKNRNHQVTFFQIPDGQAKVLAAGLNCELIGKDEFPLGWTEERNAERGHLSEIAAINYAINSYFQPLAAINLRDLPDAIKAANIDLLLIDQLVSEGGTIAEYLNLPFISVCCMLLLNVEPSVPPPFLPWQYQPSWWTSKRNQLGHFLTRILTQPLWRMVGKYRQNWHLPSYQSLNDPYSKLAQICQQPSEFEFSRQQLPPQFHFTGPFIDANSREPVFFPYEKLTGQPLIYASMGTLLNRQTQVFQKIAEACDGLDVQLVIALGRVANLNNIPKFPGSPIVVGYAPQLELLKRASLTITHAGLNTTLESLSQGVPLVAIPIGNDQPAVAARIRWTGTGEVVPLNRLSTSRLRTAITQVLNDETYHQNALRFQAVIKKTGGVKQAADIIEQVYSSC